MDIINKYNNSKIYKITIGDYFYIGSTTMTLKNRFLFHSYTAKKYPHLKLYKKLNEIGWDKAEIILIKEINCNSKKELLIEENKLIILDNEKSLNCRCSHLTEYKDKEKTKQYNIKYRIEKKEKIKEYEKEYRNKKKLIPLTDEEHLKKKEYHKIYMRQRREKLKKDKPIKPIFNRKEYENRPEIKKRKADLQKLRRLNNN